MITIIIGSLRLSFAPTHPDAWRLFEFATRCLDKFIRERNQADFEI